MVVSIRLSEQETSLIKDYAKLYNTSVSDIIRRSILERIEDELDLRAYEKAKAQIDKKYVELLVTTDYYTPSRAFYDGDFIIDSEFILGNLVITLKNKETRKLCLKYGQNIG